MNDIVSNLRGRLVPNCARLDTRASSKEMNAGVPTASKLTPLDGRTNHRRDACP